MLSRLRTAASTVAGIPSALIQLGNNIGVYLLKKIGIDPDAPIEVSNEEFLQMVKDSIPDAVAQSNDIVFEFESSETEEKKSTNPETKETSYRLEEKKPEIHVKEKETAVKVSATEKIVSANAKEARAIMSENPEKAYLCALTACGLDKHDASLRFMLTEAAFLTKKEEFLDKAYDQLSSFAQDLENALHSELTNANLAAALSNKQLYLRHMKTWNQVSETVAKCYLLQAELMRLKGNFAGINKALLLYFATDMAKSYHVGEHAIFKSYLDKNSTVRAELQKEAREFIRFIDKAEEKAEAKEGEISKLNNFLSKKQEKQLEKINELIKNKKFAEAKRLLTLAIRQNPKNDWLYFLRGNVFFHEKKYDQALLNYNYAIWISIVEPENVFQMRYIEKRMETYIQIGDYERSANDLENIKRKMQEFKSVDQTARYINTRSFQTLDITFSSHLLGKAKDLIKDNKQDEAIKFLVEAENNFPDYAADKSKSDYKKNKSDYDKVKSEHFSDLLATWKKVNSEKHKRFALQKITELNKVLEKLSPAQQQPKTVPELKHNKPNEKKARKKSEKKAKAEKAQAELKAAAQQTGQVEKQSETPAEQPQKITQPQTPKPSADELKKKADKDKARYEAFEKEQKEDEEKARIRKENKDKQDRENAEKAAQRAKEAQQLAAQKEQQRQEEIRKGLEQKQQQIQQAKAHQENESKKLEQAITLAKSAPTIDEAVALMVDNFLDELIIQGAGEEFMSKAASDTVLNNYVDELIQGECEEFMSKAASETVSDNYLDELIIQSADLFLEKRNKYRTTHQINLRPFEKTISETLNQFPQETKIVGSRVWRELRHAWRKLEGDGINPKKDVDFATTTTKEHIKKLRELEKTPFYFQDSKRETLLRCDYKDSKTEVTTVLDIEIRTEMKQDLMRDAKQRNFTINTLFADQFGFVHAPIKEALQHLRDGIIAVLPHLTPEQSFTEDPIRILQAIALLTEGFKLDPNLYPASNGTYECMQATIKRFAFNFSNDSEMTNPERFNNFFLTKIFNDPDNLPNYLKNLITYGVFNNLFPPLVGEAALQNIDKFCKAIQSKNFQLHEIYMHLILSAGVNDFHKCNEFIEFNPLFKAEFKNIDEGKRLELFCLVKAYWQEKSHVATAGHFGKKTGPSGKDMPAAQQQVQISSSIANGMKNS